MDQPISFAEIVQPILTEERQLNLSSRDIALLATVKYEIERSPDGLLTIPYSTIQGLGSRIDLLDVKDAQKALDRMRFFLQSEKSSISLLKRIPFTTLENCPKFSSILPSCKYVVDIS
ncbi:MAG: hypothetical protein AUK53_03215 [Betaproteobacteria bacterium CG2_30_59_46]|nr:MAG: hypothetical protein AUK53_03215 [Betaproteobacteria bacterium CG2_30_59_46]PIQ12802.1 MAG: hypothetical protein COW70_08005 [Hydrogenophilales bacterium CG18_big_fil_WC_8_21_14_2_50_58_12]PIY00080.1 MAG: hypothetical protein COZ23_09185 [Hydrogenophilales bacterium CG_4_10_14_3_um_filter_58_23]PJB06587.1 MAG: hypothetical protein CO125_06855 [Hydrogenophilales bacterium CG_4_9_14_3_um_filter_59_35]